MNVYPPSATSVRSNVRILRERRLPQAGELAVSIGQQVSPVQVVARTTRQVSYTILPAAELLGVPADQLTNHLLVEEGAAIQRKKPLLERRSLLGSKRITSPVNGILYQVDHGRLILQHTSELFELRAMIQGVIRRTLGNRGVLIETVGAVVEGRWSSDREGFGRIKVVGGHDAVLSAEHITADVRGAILVAGRVMRRNVLELAEENSARGIVVGSIPALWIPDMARYRFPIFVTEGFGQLPMAQPIHQLLESCEGREASLLGSVDNNWSRPEIIIPGNVTGALGEAAPHHLEQLAVGQPVRICRAPHMARIGKIVAVYDKVQLTDVGTRLPGADVRLDGEQVVFVPHTNLDMIHL